MAADASQARPGQDPPSLIQPGPDSNFSNPPLDATLRRFFPVPVASLRLTSPFFAFFRVGSRFLAIFCDVGSQNGGFWKSFFDKIGLLDEKIDFAKMCVFLRRN